MNGVKNKNNFGDMQFRPDGRLADQQGLSVHDPRHAPIATIQARLAAFSVVRAKTVWMSFLTIFEKAGMVYGIRWQFGRSNRNLAIIGSKTGAMMQRNSYNISVIAGDGIGKEVVPQGLKILNAAADRFDIGFSFTEHDFSSAAYYQQHGQMLPDDWKARLSGSDAIYFGAVGWPEVIPDHISLWGSLLKFRREFDQYVNMRPARAMPGVPSPLVGRGPGDVDMIIIRENTEGEYSSIGGRMFEGTDREVVVQETVMSRIGVDRILKYAFELAAKGKKHLTSATKSNGISISMPYWDERVENMAENYPDVTVDKFHIDILVAQFVLHPDWFDVVVASNLFGDILSDLGPACTGTIGIAPSGNINPERKFPSLFEPVHGSAPDIAGKGVANPIGQIWAGAMMLDHLGEPDAARAIVTAIEAALSDAACRTADLGGTATTVTCGDAVRDALLGT